MENLTVKSALIGEKNEGKREAPNKSYVYTLHCPISDEIKYVGKTSNPKNRRNCHNVVDPKQNTNKKNLWVKGIIELGHRPIFEILEVCESEAEALYLESYWIWQFKAWGFSLTNEATAGKGKGIHSNEFRRKMSVINKNRKASDEKKAMASAFHRGKKLSKKTKDLVRKYKESTVPNINKIKDAMVIKVYPSMTAASKELYGCRRAIAKAILNKTEYLGHYWTKQ